MSGAFPSDLPATPRAVYTSPATTAIISSSRSPIAPSAARGNTRSTRHPVHRRRTPSPRHGARRTAHPRRRATSPNRGPNFPRWPGSSAASCPRRPDLPTRHPAWRPPICPRASTKSWCASNRRSMASSRGIDFIHSIALLPPDLSVLRRARSCRLAIDRRQRCPNAGHRRCPHLLLRHPRRRCRSRA